MQDTLLTFPCQFPIKIMGQNHPDFISAVLNTVNKHTDTPLSESAIHTRLSAQGNYLAITITLMAQSRESLDNIYRELSSHPLVKMVL